MLHLQRPRLIKVDVERVSKQDRISAGPFVAIADTEKLAILAAEQ